MTDLEITQQLGKCLCGKIEIGISSTHCEIGSCHCSMCQTWGGGPFLSIDVGDQFTLKGEANLSVYASSEWAERAFCSNCGTNIYFRLKKTNGYYFLAGLFQRSEADFVLHHQIYIDQKPDYYGFEQDTPVYTAKDVEALFSVD